jgi:hypothetical protein
MRKLPPDTQTMEPRLGLSDATLGFTSPQNMRRLLCGT